MKKPKKAETLRTVYCVPEHADYHDDISEEVFQALKAEAEKTTKKANLKPITQSAW